MRNVDPNQDLSWEGGMGLLFSTVYFGQSFEEVSDKLTADVCKVLHDGLN